MVVSFDSSAPSASLKLSFFMGTPRGPSGGGSRELAEAGEILSPRLRLLLNRADISGAEKGVDFDQSKECGGGAEHAGLCQQNREAGWSALLSAGR